MPPFRLEAYKGNPQQNKIPRTIYCKKIYNKNVRVADWEKYLHSEPFDTDPYCPEGYNLHLSHYRFLGTAEEPDYKTTTQEMLENGLVREDLSTHKKFAVNVEYLDCGQMPTYTCPPVQPTDYVTTMQRSFTLPYPYEMKRLSMPTIPFYQNRKMTTNANDCKFLDDAFIHNTRLMQQHKGLRGISYNPCTNLYTDGTASPDEVFKCVDIEKQN